MAIIPHDLLVHSLFSLRKVDLSGDSGKVLSDIDLELKPLRLYLIAGPSGGGKTSLLRLMNGLAFPTSGDVLYCGKPVRDFFLPQLRSEVVMLTQEPILSGATVYESIMITFSFASHRSKKPNDDRIRQLMDWLGLDMRLLKQHISRLSGGEKQRVALIRALLTDPSVLLIDEPTSALDPLSEERVLEVLASLKQSVSLIVVSHSSRMLDAADEIILVSHGTVVDRRDSIDTPQFRRFLNEGRAAGG